MAQRVSRQASKQQAKENSMSQQTDEVRTQVRDRYAAAATAVTTGGSASCCGSDGGVQAIEIEEGFGSGLYADEDRDALPAEAVTASLGCGNPLAVADLHEGETVLDLGSGGGIDVLLSARRVGPSGKAYGVDMTDEMLALARANAAKAGAANVEFVMGTIESVPLPDASVDVIISNCVINLSTDKPAVLAEAHRLLRPGGRFGVSDVVAEDHLDAAQRAERGSYVGCIAGALSIGEYRDGLAAAGFTDISITPTHQVADGMHSAIIRASKPAADSCCGVHACCTPQEHAVQVDVTGTEAKTASGCGCVSTGS
jgi:arsenite methyltransferase